MTNRWLHALAVYMLIILALEFWLLDLDPRDIFEIYVMRGLTLGS